MGILLVLPGDLGTLIDFYSFVAWLVYGFSAFTLLVLRYTEPDTKREYKVSKTIKTCTRKNYYMPHKYFFIFQFPRFEVWIIQFKLLNIHFKLSIIHFTLTPPETWSCPTLELFKC